jgi:hypothetical protein
MLLNEQLSDVLDGFVKADGVAVINFQVAENHGGQDGQFPQENERLVNSVNHFRRTGVRTIGNEKHRGQ